MKIKEEKFIRHIGERIRLLRLERKMSQEVLANTADIPINQIGRIERGEINTTIVTIKVIADSLNISVSELFMFE